MAAPTLAVSPRPARASDPCQGITEEGCCDGQMLRWCGGSSVQSESCPGSRGWGDDEDVTATPMGARPQRNLPKACP